MTTYVYDHVTNKVVLKGTETVIPKGPYVRGDLPEYMSPLSGKPVEGRSARREEMARHNVRELEPSERVKDQNKTKEMATAEKAQLDARQSFAMSDQARERLLG